VGSLVKTFFDIKSVGPTVLSGLWELKCARHVFFLLTFSLLYYIIYIYYIILFLYIC